MSTTAENSLGNWGLIAGNGDFPFLVLEGARSRGIEMSVIAIREEASPALERTARRFHWISLGELSRGIDLLHQEGVTGPIIGPRTAGHLEDAQRAAALHLDSDVLKRLDSIFPGYRSAPEHYAW